MTDEQAPTGGAAAASSALDLGEILAGPFRDPRALEKFLWGCLAVVCIPVFGLGLLALLGYLFQTAQRARQGEEHPMPEWRDPGQLLSDGIWVLAVILGYLLPLLALTIVMAVFGFIPVLGGLANAVLGPLNFVLGLLASAVLPIGLARMAATREIGSAFRIQEHLRLIQAQLGTYVVFLLILILIGVLSGASAALCFVGIIPGIFWSQAASGTALGRAARTMGI